MKSGGKSVINFFFLLFFAAGAAVIFYMDSFRGAQSFFIPAALVGLYGFFISIVIRKIDDADLADHYAETIYFIGFLFTLVSLAVLFYRFGTGFIDLSEKDQISEVFFFIGISVTTSIIGVLLRNMIRAGYLIRHPDSSDDLEKSYILLKEIAGSFTKDYSDTFETIKAYLEERKENTALFNEREKEYLESLGSFSDTTKNFTKELSEIQFVMKDAAKSFSSVLYTQTESISELNSASGQLREATQKVKQDIEELPVDEAVSALKTLAQETGELDTVIDSIISILDEKLRRAG